MVAQTPINQRGSERAVKVGILTLHSQLNYGGVLQAYALQETIKAFGHEVMIIDRTMVRGKGNLRGITGSRSVVNWINFIGRGILGFGDFADLKRRLKTYRFINQVLNLSPYSFFLWNEAPKSLGVDILIVGSDQVWNPTDSDVLATHLLEKAPKVDAISYAASFGIKQIPAELEKRYCAGLSKFRKISVRETEGVRIVQNLGYVATKVIDPVLISDVKIWDRLSNAATVQKKCLFCYFLSVKLDSVATELCRFAHQQNAIIKVFSQDGCIELPSSRAELLRTPVSALKQRLSPLKMQSAAGPDEFVSALRSCTWVATDSFHALAFSILFKKNVRVIKPTDKSRKGMFARIEETVSNYATGPIIAESCKDALISFSAGDQTHFDDLRIAQDKATSLLWLKNAMEASNA